MYVLERDGLDDVKDRPRARQAEWCRLRDDLQVAQCEIKAEHIAVLTVDNVSASVDKLQRTSQRDDLPELRVILRTLAERITIAGREYKVTWTPEAEPWFRVP